ncbi:ferredoxin [Virgibacillus dokdonensis]|uniref:Ferredoxin n=1 Tax=Virgibacillus dokdonensis TaxID=302167 RepID=A0A3E0WYW1_9BACI|nr:MULTISPECIES: ferredoxin [Virgibacillus]RFA37216.1 ferredoxin [Virgibacillus dokdonensis]
MCYYTKVDRETCIACGACGISAPDLYDYDDDCIAYFLKDNNLGVTPVEGDQINAMFDAYEECPTGSVKVSKQPF